MSARAPAVFTAVLALLAAGCGGGDRPDARTPGVTPQPATGPRAAGREATATPSPDADAGTRRRVPRSQVRVIRGWADALRTGHVARAVRFFARPSIVSNGTPPIRLSTRADIRAFNQTLPCGARLERIRPAPHRFVYGVFTLTERPGGNCGTGTGQEATVAFLVRRGHIRQWVRVPNVPAGTGSEVS